jgi:hypothetical protein
MGPEFRFVVSFTGSDFVPCKLCVRVNRILHFARREKHTINSRNALSTLRVVTIAFCMLIAFGIPTFGQEAPLQQEASAPKSAPDPRPRPQNCSTPRRTVQHFEPSRCKNLGTAVPTPQNHQ